MYSKEECVKVVCVCVFVLVFTHQFILHVACSSFRMHQVSQWVAWLSVDRELSSVGVGSSSSMGCGQSWVGRGGSSCTTDGHWLSTWHAQHATSFGGGAITMATNTRSQCSTNRSGVSRNPPVSASKPPSKRKRTTSSAAENPKNKQQKQDPLHDEDEIRGTGTVLYSAPPIPAGILRNPQEWDRNRTEIQWNETGTLCVHANICI